MEAEEAPMWVHGPEAIARTPQLHFCWPSHPPSGPGVSSWYTQTRWLEKAL